MHSMNRYLRVSCTLCRAFDVHVDVYNDVVRRLRHESVIVF